MRLKVIGILTSLLAVIVCGAFFSGLVLSVLWGWFIVPALHANPITIPQAIGISLVVGMVVYQPSSSKDKNKGKEDESIGATLFTAFCVATIAPLFTLAIGAIVHAFV